MPVRPRVLVAVLCAVVLGALLPVTAASAASRTVQGGRLDWGVKASFQSYVTGPIAKGSYSLTGGAASVGSGGFRFHSATGTYDGDTGAFTASFSGGVHFVGHRTGGGSYQLDLTISRPPSVYPAPAARCSSTSPARRRAPGRSRRPRRCPSPPSPSAGST